MGKIPSSNLRSSTSSSRSSRAPYHASRRSMRRSASSSSLGSMAGKDGDHIDDELSGEMSSEHSSVLTESIMRKKAVNKVILNIIPSLFCDASNFNHIASGVNPQLHQCGSNVSECLVRNPSA